MRRINRNLNVFSVAAIDLFASALGAFLIIMVVLIPYYPNTGVTQQEVEEVELEAAEAFSEAEASAQAAAVSAQTAAAALAAADAAEAEAATERQAAADALEAATNAGARAVELEDRVTDLEQEIEDLSAENSALTAELDNKIEFALLGLETRATRFLLVVDLSGSMEQFEGLMMQTVTRILSSMDDSHQVAILGFHRPQTRGVLLHDWPRGGGLRRMDNSGKQEVTRQMQVLLRQVEGGTPTMQAMQRALTYNVDAVILITDGAPDTNSDSIVATITAQNAGRREIHTVAIGEYFSRPSFTLFLQELARRNRGDFAGVAG